MFRLLLYQLPEYLDCFHRGRVPRLLVRQLEAAHDHQREIALRLELIGILADELRPRARAGPAGPPH
jgi:hypothetical protein